MAVIQLTKKKVKVNTGLPRIKQVCDLQHPRWNRCMRRSHKRVEENGVSNQDCEIKVGLLSNSCG